MASNSKESLIRRVSGQPGAGIGANTGLGTREVVIPELPSLPSRLSDQSIREFRDAMERWRVGLQAQFPIPQSSSSAVTVDVSDQVSAAIESAVAGINSRISGFMSSITERVSRLETAAPSTPIDLSQYTTEQDVKNIISNARHVHYQGTASLVWTITHNLGWKPSIAVVDMSQNVVVGDVSYPSTNVAVVTFSGEFSGYAYCN